MSYAQVFETMFKLCITMLLGVVLNRLKVINEEGNKTLSRLIVEVTSPALAIYAVCGQTGVNTEVIKLVGFGALLYLALPVLAFGIVLLMKPPRALRGVYQLLLVFGNVSFMGYPVVQAIYGEQAIFYMNILNIPFTLMIFTYGVRLLGAGELAGGGKLRAGHFLSPGFISAVLSLLVYFLRIPVPSAIANTLGFVGNLTTPLSMLAIGSMIANFSPRALFAERKLFLLTAIKLLAMPVGGFALARVLFADPVMVGTVTLSLAMPSGALCAMVSRQHGTDLQAGSAALGVFLTTLVSMITIPLVIFTFL